MHETLRQFHPVIAHWFATRVGEPTPPQVLGWPLIGEGKSSLILAPTGSGKTLAAFLAGIDWVAKRLLAAEANDRPAPGGIQIVYVSPLKSLANDVQKNLVKPLREMAEVAAELGGHLWPEITVGVRTGDTPAKDRAAMNRRPPHILITTPESLNLMLTSGMRGAFGSVKYLIVDEVHALAGTKRGVFLTLVLERLVEEREMLSGANSSRGEKIAPGVYLPVENVGPIVRVGLSATARPAERIGAWLAGIDSDGTPRPMQIVSSGQRKKLDLGVVCPFGDEMDPSTPRKKTEGEDKEKEKEKGVGHWPEVTRAVLDMIRTHRSTLVFANSRRLIERLAAKFQEELETEVHDGKTTTEALPRILPHHGSISKEVRLETEQALKRGELDAVLATSSLELGIDVGALDLVVQVDSPGNVAGALQRVGRAGHLEKATAKGRLLARGLAELPSLGALVPLMYAGEVEETTIPENCLDVLAQQIVAACVVRPWTKERLFRIVKRAMPFRALSEKQFENVVEMLSRRAERVTTQGLRPRLSYDRVNGELTAMPGVAKVLMMNSGVISDTGQFPVYVIGAKRGRVELDAPSNDAKSPREAADPGSIGVRIGELDEEFVYETKEGDRVLLGSQVWRVVRIDADRVLVEAAEPGASRMPFWRGEAAPRSELMGNAVATFHGEMERRLKADGDIDAAKTWLRDDHHFDEQAASNAVGYYLRQMAAGNGMLPTDKRVVVEHFIDRTGEPIIAILCPLGSRVNHALRLSLEGHFARRKLPAQLVHHDDGILIRPPVEIGEIPENPLAWLRAGAIEAEIADQLENTALFGLRFRQNAARALMLPRMTVTQRTPLWQQRLRARHLLALVKKHRNFPIIVETYREVLQDVLGITRVERLLSEMERGQVSVTVVRNTEPSAFARSLYGQFQQTYLYAWDDPLTPAQPQPTIDQNVLDDILQRRAVENGEGELIERWMPADEETLRRRIAGSDYPARTNEELLEKIEATGAVGVPFDAPNGVGDTWREWAVGGAPHAKQMLIDLSAKRRVVVVHWAKNVKRWIATENVALLLAAMTDSANKRPRAWTFTPTGELADLSWEDIPTTLTDSDMDIDEARRLVVEQALKLHPTTRVEDITATLPWMKKNAATLVEELIAAKRLLKLPDDRLLWQEYAEQLRSIALRRERQGGSHGGGDVAALQRHLLRWQHLEVPLNGFDGVEDVLDMLMGVSLPLDVWTHDVLPLRVKGFVPTMLDDVCRRGHRLWVGVGHQRPETDNPEPRKIDVPEGAVSFWPRHLIAERPRDAVDATHRWSPAAEKILTYLRERGASFFSELQIDLVMDDGELATAMLELAYTGTVSSDSLDDLREAQRLAANAERDRDLRTAKLRARLSTRDLFSPAAGFRRLPKVGKHQLRVGRHAQSTGLGGRWFLLPSPRGSNPTDTHDAQHATRHAEEAADRVERLLRRTAFACRELSDTRLDGSWRSAYEVLTRMEWAGGVRRGYFVEGISGSQFMVPGILLDAESDPQQVVWISMIDPANVWSHVSTRWVSDSGEVQRVPRTPGTWIALVQGRPVLAAINWGRRLIPLPATRDDQTRALKTVHTLLDRIPRAQRAMLEIRQWDQGDLLGSWVEPLLKEQGFSRDTQGVRLYRQYFTQP